jgi:copper chaperone
MPQTAIKLKIDGMHCDACVRRVTAALQKLPAVAVDRVAIGEADIVFDASRLQPQAIVDSVDAIGFHAEVAS